MYGMIIGPNGEPIRQAIHDEWVAEEILDQVPAATIRELAGRSGTVLVGELADDGPSWRVLVVDTESVTGGQCRIYQESRQ
jgi:hypothetical protein